MIEFKNISFTFTNKIKPSISNINFNINEGDFLGIIGPNGAGKTTLCNSIIGFVPHYFNGEMTGDVIVNGINTKDSTIPELAKMVGYVFQNPFDQLTGVSETVFEEVAFGLIQHGVSREKITKKVFEVLRQVGLENEIYDHPFKLSGGQQQRLSIASVLALDSPILLLDESTSQLDPLGTKEVFQIADKLHKNGKTIIMVEHKLDLLAKYANRIAVIYDGQLQSLDSPEIILTDSKLGKWKMDYPVIVSIGKKLRDEGLAKGLPPITLEKSEIEIKRIININHGT